MKIKFIKICDEYFGRLICYIFKLFNFNKHDPNNRNDSKNILFIKFWGLGSIILSTTALKLVKQKYPNSNIYFLSLNQNSDLLRLINEVNFIYTVRISNPLSFLIDTIKVIYLLRKLKIDAVIDFEFFAYYSALLTRFIKPELSIGYDNQKNNRTLLFTSSVLFNDKIHVINNFINIVSKLLICDKPELSEEIKIPKFNINVKSEFKKLQHKFILHKPFILINPNASSLAYERRLPKNYFVKIISELLELKNILIILIGSKDEYNYVNSIYINFKNNNRIKNIAGLININELFALISNSLCLITNDSGPLHIASAYNIPAISFFGPESPVRYGSLSTNKLTFYRNLKCSPCMSISNKKTVNCIYDEPICMTGFEIDKITSKIKPFINNLIAINHNY